MIRTYATGQGVAILVPCYNEENAIAQVVRDFHRTLPDAAIYIYDNNSSDRTAEIARASGAVVRGEALQGKGHVVRRMFADVEAEIYVMVDGDATYDATSAPVMIEKLVADGLDMVVGCREEPVEGAYRQGHQFGNALFTRAVGRLFGKRFTDILSGYRVFSRRFVKSFPALSSGFEIETELTVHALSLWLPVGEVRTPYRARPQGTASKLRTFHDGWRILMTVLALFRDERPLTFFSLAGIGLAAVSVCLAVPVILAYWRTGLVTRLPTALLSTGIMLVAVLSIVCGMILDTVSRGRREIKRLRYLAEPMPGLDEPRQCWVPGLVRHDKR